MNTTNTAPGALEGLPPLIRLSEAAEVLGVCIATARKLCEDGTLKSVRVGRSWRVNSASLLEFAGLA